jgi:DNA adenine methylase
VFGIKTPIAYYGGKQTLAKRILALVPEHRAYCEPFFGGGAVFFAKEPSKVEVINDANGELVNFYEVVKGDFAALQREIEASLHSRERHRRAAVVYENPDMFSRVKRAWAVWTLANASYGNRLDGGFACDRGGKAALALDNKRLGFASADYADRLRRALIERRDALEIIKTHDAEDAFFYLDPPYVGTDQGHYDGYGQEDFDALLRALERLKGKFLLSSFRNKALREFSGRNGWRTLEFNMAARMAGGRKVEVLTANYAIEGKSVEPCGKEALDKG